MALTSIRVNKYRSSINHCVSAITGLTAALLGSLVISISAFASTGDYSDEASKLYRKTLQAISKGHKTNTQQGMQQLADYPLYPYLEKAELNKRLNLLPKADVETFLKKYENTVVSAQMQRSWLETLAKKQQWQDYLEYYSPQVATITLRCNYLEALHQAGYETLSLSKTAEIWLSAESLPSSCDAAFKRWKQAGFQTDELVWQRFQLALQQGNTLLARYLSKHASAELKPYTRRMLSVHARPLRLEQDEDFIESNPYTADIVSHGLLRLATSNPDKTSALWSKYRGGLQFSTNQNNAIRDKIARQLIASGSDHALSWLIANDPNAEDSYLLEWRIRLALKDQQWSQAEQWINLLPPTLQQQPRWRYWLARAQQDSTPEQANQLLASLSTERNYYGFLAADLLGLPYDFNNDQLDTQSLDSVSENAAIIRAKLFYEMNEYVAARREWLSAINELQGSQLIAATKLAHNWGWHQQAIQTTIKANHWDDLSIRFPLAYQQDMTRSAQKTAIPLEWLYAITRQESSFAEDAASSAGARGLMQLLPGTAKQVARTIGLPFDTKDLLRPETNIELGSNYLKHLLNEFHGNHILATAAYNAGPQKVRRWLKNLNQNLPSDILIETLPFHETRNYVQSVMAFSIIYSHRLGMETPLLKRSQESLSVAGISG